LGHLTMSVPLPAIDDHEADAKLPATPASINIMRIKSGVSSC
jgi:hypothetical protein